MSAGSYTRFLNLQVIIVIILQLLLCACCAAGALAWREQEGELRVPGLPVPVSSPCGQHSAKL